MPGHIRAHHSERKVLRDGGGVCVHRVLFTTVMLKRSEAVHVLGSTQLFPLFCFLANSRTMQTYFQRVSEPFSAATYLPSTFVLLSPSSEYLFTSICTSVSPPPSSDV